MTFDVVFDCCVQPKYKFSEDDVLLPCNIAYILFVQRDKCSFTQADIHESQCHCVNFISASIQYNFH